MATNYYTKFAFTTGNAKTDNELAGSFATVGIASGSVAYTDVLNGILRQVSVATHALAEFTKNYANQNIGSSTFTAVLLENALDAWVGSHNFADNAQMPFIKGANIDPSQHGQLKVWYGTEAQYNLLTPAADTIYFIY